MTDWKNIRLKIEGNRANLILHRPEVHNALNPGLIREIGDALDLVSANNKIRFLVLSGEGKSFCAGADIKWFASAREKTKMENWQEFLKFPELLKKLYTFPKITISVAHGNVKGGGNGLIVSCDFAVAELPTIFAFSEIKLGIVPATIMPFIARRVSIRNMKKLMYSGSNINTTEAKKIGLIDYLADSDNTMQVLDKLISNLQNSAPNALQTCKQLLLKNETGEINIENGEYTSSVLADLVHSEEGKEGLQAFLEKRKPNWSTTETKRHR